MKSGLTITSRRDEPVQILKISGYLDGHTFVELEQHIDQIFKGGSHRLVIDLSELTYIASAGVGVFINAQHQARKAGGNLQLVNPTQSVREIFGILGLETIFTIHATVDQGLRVAKR
jgi:anti-sigma B factor antagonist